MPPREVTWGQLSHPQAWQGWDLEYAWCLCDPISRPAKPVSQEARQLTSLDGLQVPPTASHLRGVLYYIHWYITLQVLLGHAESRRDSIKRL